MNDYKKLIKRLRYGDYMMNSDPFTLNTKMIEWSAKAADAIEQLMKERDRGDGGFGKVYALYRAEEQ